VATLVSVLLTVVDLVFVFSLLVLAWFALWSRDLFRSCLLFITFGMVMALVWARLRAPDVALAEAAIGSGITGALLLAALRGVRLHAVSDDEGDFVQPAEAMIDDG
jgi:uncharacterized MnhB-related membrane protein